MVQGLQRFVWDRKKNEIKLFLIKVNLPSFDVAFLVFYSHFSPISTDLDDLPSTEFPDGKSSRSTEKKMCDGK